MSNNLQKYRREINLYHNEEVWAIDKETGEQRTIHTKVNNIPDGKIIFQPNKGFTKVYNSVGILINELDPIEFKIAMTMIDMIEYGTNSLYPLNDSVKVKELMHIFKLSKNVIRPALLRLYNMGVYLKYSEQQYDDSKPYTRYWILNPHIAFKGSIIYEDIAAKFSQSYITLKINETNK